MAPELRTSLGSSPHTRGARADPSKNLMDRRIIPAYAGSTRGVGDFGCEV